MATISRLFGAIIAACKAYAVAVQYKIAKDIDAYEEKIYTLSMGAGVTDVLRIELLNKQKQRKIELLGAIQSTVSDIEGR